jgi:hypothetical protein
MPTWQPYGSDLIGAKHIAGSGGGFEPQREHNFEILITPPVGDGQVLLKSVETGFAPSHSSDPLMLPYMNEIVYVAGRNLFMTRIHLLLAMQLIIKLWLHLLCMMLKEPIRAHGMLWVCGRKILLQICFRIWVMMFGVLM